MVAGPPVIVEEHYYGRPYCGPPPRARYYHRRPARGVEPVLRAAYFTPK